MEMLCSPSEGGTGGMYFLHFFQYSGQLSEFLPNLLYKTSQVCQEKQLCRKGMKT